MQPEVWVMNQGTGTCGQGRGSFQPHSYFPRSFAHRKSKTAHKFTLVSVHMDEGKKKNSCLLLRVWPSNSPIAKAVFSPKWWPAAAAHKYRPPKARTKGSWGWWWEGSLAWRLLHTGHHRDLKLVALAILKSCAINGRAVSETPYGREKSPETSV